jgi:hypothetical protein
VFTIHPPVERLDALARQRVYGEYIKQPLRAVAVGCHNDMIMLAEDPQSGAAVAVLLAKGEPGTRIVFPRHLHLKGERTICLDGEYGEYLLPGENPDDLFEGGMTLAAFQRAFPGVVQLLPPEADGKVPVKLGLGAHWSMGDNTEHKPFGWAGPRGLLMGQIYWGGPNEVTEGKSP